MVSQNRRLCSAWPSVIDVLPLLFLLLLIPLAVVSAVLVIRVERWLLLLLMSLLLMLLPITYYLLRDKQCFFPASRQAQIVIIYSVTSSVSFLRHDKYNHWYSVGSTSVQIVQDQWASTS